MGVQHWTEIETLSAFFSEMKYDMSVDNSAILCGIHVDKVWIKHKYRR